MSHLYIAPSKSGDICVHTENEHCTVDGQYTGRHAAFSVYKFLKDNMNEAFMHRMSRLFLEYTCNEVEVIKETLLANPKTTEYTKSPISGVN